MKQILLNTLYKVLKVFAKIYLYRTKPFVIWITWSVWKTSCRMIISQILEKYIDEEKIYTSSKNFNSEIGLVLSIFSIEEYTPWIKSLLKLILKLFFKSFFQSKKYDILVLEYWIDKPNDMEFLLSIVKPDISIFTKIDYIHAENFPDSKVWVLKEKMKLILNSKQKIYMNCSDLELKEEYKKIIIEKKCFYDIEDFKYNLDKNNIFAEFKIGETVLKTNILWSENFTYINLWFSILEYFWIKLKEKEIFLSFKNQYWRFSILEWIKWNILIDSTYNAGPESMKKMIENTLKIKDSLSIYKVIFILWDMRELWEISEKAHKEIWNLLKKQELVLTVWKQMKRYCSFQNFKNSDILWKYLLEFLENTDEKYIILFKGSQNTIFLEESIKLVLKNKQDKNKLVRQQSYWMKIKRDFFSS